MDLLAFSLVALFDLFIVHPVIFTLLILALAYAKVSSVLRRRSLQQSSGVIADQEAIERCIEQWRAFRPEIMPVVFADLTKIRREQDSVRIGHLTWLSDKVAGMVDRGATPPTY